MLWVKSFHIIFMVTWFAGLFYLPRLFVYHAMCDDEAGNARFKIMERKLLWGIMTPGGVITVLLGLWLIGYYPAGAFAAAGWLHAKLFLGLLLIGYHVWCVKLWKDFRADRNTRSHVWFRWFNEVPVAFLIAMILLVELQPF
jgi:putative membrane protein